MVKFVVNWVLFCLIIYCVYNKGALLFSTGG